MTKFGLFSVIALSFLLSGCNSAMMQGFAQGMTNNLERQNRQASALGMSGSQARGFERELKSTMEDSKRCHDANKRDFIQKYPQYAWATKDADELTAADFADPRKISGNAEYQALVEFIANEEICLDASMRRIQGYGGVAAEIVGMMEIATTEMLIVYAEYLSGEITLGQMNRKGTKIISGLKQSGDALAAQVRERRTTIEQTAALQQLRRENKNLLNQIQQRELYNARSYRPVYCYEYYGINTFSCY